MAMPTAVVTQLAIINININRLLTDRDRINNVFEDALGNSTWNLLSASNQTVVKNAITSDMQTAITALQAARDVLAAL